MSFCSALKLLSGKVKVISTTLKKLNAYEPETRKGGGLNRTHGAPQTAQKCGHLF